MGGSIGAGAGLALGASLGHLAAGFCEYECGGEVGTLAAIGTFSGLVVGTAIGGLIGAFIRSDRWEEVPLDQLRVQPVATVDGRFGLAVSLSF